MPLRTPLHGTTVLTAARQQAWRRRWLPVLLVLAVIFGVLPFLTFA